jgi:hypothetical protein
MSIIGIGGCITPAEGSRTIGRGPSIPIIMFRELEEPAGDRTLSLAAPPKEDFRLIATLGV